MDTATGRMRPWPFLVLLPLLFGVGVHRVWREARPSAENRYGPVVHETRSSFSHIRIREKGSVRSLLFVDAEGTEQCQSSLDLTVPGRLRHAYARTLFASLLYRHPQERVLIVGLGGGGMVRFLERAFPETEVEAVEIDLVVVRLAADFFGTKAGAKTKIHTGDAFDFFTDSRGLYDAIYLDAFLRAPEETGLGERTERLKTRDFLEKMRDHLVPGGVAAFNLVEADARTPGDLAAIRSVFPETALFSVPGTGNLVAVSLRDGTLPGKTELIERAAALEGFPELGFSPAALVEQWRE